MKCLYHIMYTNQILIRVMLLSDSIREYNIDFDLHKDNRELVFLVQYFYIFAHTNKTM